MWLGLYPLSVLIMVAHVGAAEKPVVTFSPNWNVIFTREPIVMTCNVRTSPAGNIVYTWTWDNREIHSGRTYVLRNTTGRHTGSYRCKGSNTVISDPATLSVSNGWVILQAPLYVHEGDDLTLRCHSYPGYEAGSSIFYKENQIIRGRTPDPEFHMKNISLEASGAYVCWKDLGRDYRGDTTITIRELFTTPEIRAARDLMEGDAMTLKCHTNISPFKLQLDLLFAFYKDGEVARGFHSSDQYGVAFAQLEHSGKYHCEVKTPNDRVKKGSRDHYITITEMFTIPEIIADQVWTEGDAMTLKCHTNVSSFKLQPDLLFAFYKGGEVVRGFNSSDQYGVDVALLEHSGKYHCEVKMANDGVKKGSQDHYITITGQLTITTWNIVTFSLSGLLLIIAAVFIFYHIRFMKSLPPAM